MKEFYIKAIMANLNTLNEHFLKCVLAYTNALAGTRKAGEQ